MAEFLFVFGRQILPKTFQPIQSKEGIRIRNNRELQKLIKRGDIVQYTTAQMIKWLGCLDRIEDIKPVKKITDWNRTGVRAKGKPKKETDRRSDKRFQEARTETLERIVRETKAWNGLVRRTIPHVGM
jgi:hypothetical protein